jgi:hypothetical protein
MYIAQLIGLDLMLTYSRYKFLKYKLIIPRVTALNKNKKCKGIPVTVLGGP